MSLETALQNIAPGLLRYCRGRTGCPSLAEEVAQDALRALVERWHKAGPPDDISAFVFVVARRRAARLVAKRRFLRPLESLAERPSRDLSPAAAVLVKDRLAATARALRCLPERDREVLLLFASAELDLATISKTLGLSLSATKMRLHRARRRLLDQMETSHELA